MVLRCKGVMRQILIILPLYGLKFSYTSEDTIPEFWSQEYLQYFTLINTNIYQILCFIEQGFNIPYSSLMIHFLLLRDGNLAILIKMWHLLC